MRNLISGDFELTPDQWILSILRHNKGDHACLILEGLDAENKRDIYRAELVYRLDTNTVENKGMPYCQILFTKKDEVDIERLRKTEKEGVFCYQSYPIDAEKKDEFFAIVQKDQLSFSSENVPYVRFGNKNTLAGGFFGNSIERVGGQSNKQASIEANYANPTTLCVDASIDATLQRGHSCVSWASEKMQQSCPDYKPSLLGQLFVSVPQIELPREQSNTFCVMQ
ncbi:MAG: hypothetical protein H0U73_13410 [Tatlockia sp.]|nr:hypothetical protein [Tatlockia sp.]